MHLLLGLRGVWTIAFYLKLFLAIGFRSSGCKTYFKWIDVHLSYAFPTFDVVLDYLSKRDLNSGILHEALMRYIIFVLMIYLVSQFGTWIFSVTQFTQFTQVD